MANLDNALTRPGGAQRPPAAPSGLSAWTRGYFDTPGNAVVSVLCLLLIAMAARAVLAWLVLDAVWSGGPAECKAGAGACWPFIARKLRFMLFGFFPYEEQWRPALALLIMAAMSAVTMIPVFWRRGLLSCWLAALVAMFLLMHGGVRGLVPVPTTKWGGLPLTVMLSFVGLAAAFPIGVALALARRSKLPAIRVLAVVYIEVIRGVPLISMLFMASILFPLFLPDGVTINGILRAQVAIILFAAAYVAEVVRGGLQGIPNGQYEAAASLGLGYWRMMRLVILPQALKIVIPPMVTTFIGFFQDTSLVTIIGLFDLLNTVRGAMRDPEWQGIAVLEGYVFAGVIYFALSYAMGRYSRYLEARFHTGHA